MDEKLYEIELDLMDLEEHVGPGWLSQQLLKIVDKIKSLQEG